MKIINQHATDKYLENIFQKHALIHLFFHNHCIIFPLLMIIIQAVLIMEDSRIWAEIVMGISRHKWDNILAQSNQEMCKYLAKQRNIPKSYSELSISFFLWNNCYHAGLWIGICEVVRPYGYFAKWVYVSKLT